VAVATSPPDRSRSYDVIIVGSGTSGGFVAESLVDAGMDCLMLEAGELFDRETYPEDDLDSVTRLYWSGGAEFNEEYSIGLLRPKCVGGGSIVNQALMNRFDDEAFDAWREESAIEYFTSDRMAEWYERAEDRMQLEQIPLEHANRNSDIFMEGCEAKGYDYHRLRRAQRQCHYEDGNDCIECLGGCRIDSKQSTLVTTIHDALEKGLTLVPEFEVTRLSDANGTQIVLGRDGAGRVQKFRADKVVLAAGAIGNSKILLRSGYDAGNRFYCHPQKMIFGRFDEPVEAFDGAFQAVASSDPDFREAGFKLENVFSQPASLALLFPGIGEEHEELMANTDKLACIEVSTRDTNPGQIHLDTDGECTVEKHLDAEDRSRLADGTAVIRGMLEAAGANEIIEGHPNIGLHLMGGCPIGNDPSGVVDPDFTLRENDDVYVADSSIFPNAPGINPALTIMALSLKMADRLTEEGV
jgi:choline dehydrogenase-like flavoprotein